MAENDLLTILALSRANPRQYGWTLSGIALAPRLARSLMDRAWCYRRPLALIRAIQRAAQRWRKLHPQAA